MSDELALEAVLTVTCGCGRSRTVPCPTLANEDRAAAFAALEVAGWRWDDRLGYVCPEHPGCFDE